MLKIREKLGMISNYQNNLTMAVKLQAPYETKDTEEGC